MGTRLELQAALENVFVEIGRWLWDPFNFESGNVREAIKAHAHEHVYFQPPATVQMKYPCIVYSLSNVGTIFANNLPYRHKKAYDVMVIDKNPDSEIPDKIGAFPLSSFKTKYTKENLNHTVYRLYF